MEKNTRRHGYRAPLTMAQATYWSMAGKHELGAKKTQPLGKELRLFRQMSAKMK